MYSDKSSSSLVGRQYVRHAPPFQLSNHPTSCKLFPEKILSLAAPGIRTDGRRPEQIWYRNFGSCRVPVNRHTRTPRFIARAFGLTHSDSLFMLAGNQRRRRTGPHSQTKLSSGTQKGLEWDLVLFCILFELNSKLKYA